MEPNAILIVEDEFIVARNLQRRLETLGYAVPALAATVAQSIAEAGRVRPDLVLMDVRLQDGGDGIAAAREIRRRYGTPIVYLTAYADDETLERAKDTMPLGFLPKPFGLRELRTTIEVALHKSRVERQARAAERWLAGVLAAVDEGVIAADAAGAVITMNAAAERLTGVPPADAVGLALDRVLSPVPDGARSATPDLLNLQGVVTLRSHDGRETRVSCTSARIDDGCGQPAGTLLVLRPLT